MQLITQNTHFGLLFRAELQIKISELEHLFNRFKNQKDNRNYTSPLTHQKSPESTVQVHLMMVGGRKKEILPLYLMLHTYHSRKELEPP